MINAIFYPIFIHSNGTSDITNEGFLSVMLAFIVLGVFMLIGSFIYSICKAKISTYWGFNWNDIKTIWSNTLSYLIGWTFIILPIVSIFFAFLIYYINQILF